MVQIKRKQDVANHLVVKSRIQADGQELVYLTFPAFDNLPMVRHLFSTRLGGVSEGDCASLNFAFTRDTSNENVLENYRRIAEILGIGAEDFVASHQTHTTNICRVTEADCGKGIVRARDYSDVDGLVTDVPEICLVTFHADCVPLFFVDPVHNCIGLAHSGWRGTADKMGARMVQKMQECFGTNPEDLHVGIGPSICVDCYEVGEDVAEFFFDIPGALRKGKTEGKFQLDLWKANQYILKKAGVPTSQISVTDICTCCNKDILFSHRGSNGHRGNLAAFLMLNAKEK